MLFAGNIEHQGSGRDSLMRKEMYPKIIGFKKKWYDLKVLAGANIFFLALNEAAHLSYLMEADTVMVYQIQEAVEDALMNLNDIAEEEETTSFSMNGNIVKETEGSDNFLMANSVTVSISASNVPAHKLKKSAKVLLGRQMHLKCML